MIPGCYALAESLQILALKSAHFPLPEGFPGSGSLCVSILKQGNEDENPRNQARQFWLGG